jgi:Lhr-like helicase
VKVGRDGIEKNPDQRVQEALQLAFTKFAEFQSARQVHVWLRDQGIMLPAKSQRPGDESVIWNLPIYNTVHNILTNPVYAGAYAFGRTTSKTIIDDGRKRVRRGLKRTQTEWDVLLKD